tara:strand:+ start:297 stop:578 length:282 start_codon:yes stop_codon:yes gene_type:complete
MNLNRLNQLKLSLQEEIMEAKLYYTPPTDEKFHELKEKAMDIEVKVKPNKPSAEQLQWIEDMKKINAIAIVAYKLDDVKTALREAGIQYRGGL